MTEKLVALLLAACLPVCLSAPPASAQQSASYITAPSTLSLEDEAEMKRTIVRLNHALDAADYELYASFFAEDAEFVSGFGVAKGRAEIAAALEQSRPFITGKRHVAANFLFSGGGNEAVVTTYLIVFERAASVDYVGSAINVDTFEKRGGVWELVHHSSELDPSTAAAMQAAMAPPEEQ
ncbi:MAG: nuclear transport factor 2 family protein [Henriciella sp.]|uniref:nuclear transport factor 2 family protein n=1 Tax=Henriciella sp. TaxID=1968823 RepID=UPI003C796F17